MGVKVAKRKAKTLDIDPDRFDILQRKHHIKQGFPPKIPGDIQLLNQLLKLIILVFIAI